MFPNPRVDKAVLTPSHQICTPCQNILKRLVFIMLFGIYSNFFIVLSIRQKTCRSNGFCFFTGQNVCARKLVSEVFRALEHSEYIFGISGILYCCLLKMI